MQAPNIAIRTDATRQIGTGHFMRCLTLAKALSQLGAKIRFVSRGLPSHLCEMLAQGSIDLVLLERETEDGTKGCLQHSHWLGCSQEEDARITKQAISDRQWDWLIVDHYALDSRWECKLRGSVRRVMVIDDLADRQHDCDMLLDQNYYVDMHTRYSGRVPPKCEMLLGPRYALLREEFKELRKYARPRTGLVKKILVFFGGVDAENYTGQIIKSLAQTDLPGIKVDVVIGAQNPNLEEIEAACAELEYVCHVQTDRMAELTAEADVAIGAGGSAIWERCCLGLPSLVFCTAENQRQQLADAARHGLVYSVNANGDFALAIQRHLAALVENQSLREFLSSRGMDLVNGFGTERVVSSMGISDIGIRQADTTDSRALYQWRNDPSIREVSRDNKEIEWSSHLSWFETLLADPDRFLLIGLRGRTPVGVVRFDRQADAAEISIYTLPGLANRGVGQCLLRRAEMWLKDHHPDIRRIRAQILGNNSRSHKMFFGAGYETESTCYEKRMQQP